MCMYDRQPSVVLMSVMVRFYEFSANGTAADRASRNAMLTARRRERAKGPRLEAPEAHAADTASSASSAVSPPPLRRTEQNDDSDSPILHTYAE